MGRLGILETSSVSPLDVVGDEPAQVDETGVGDNDEEEEVMMYDVIKYLKSIQCP